MLIPMAVGMLFVCALLFLARGASLRANAAPIPPPGGYPKLIRSTFVVTPELAMPGGAELEYQVEIINTGAFTGTGVQLISGIPNNTTYNEDAWSSFGPSPVVSGTLLTWTGDVGFDSSVWITFSVSVSPTFEGVITNTAVITHTHIPAPVVLEADARITDSPMLEISKSTPPVLPGPGKPLTYTISVLNMGQGTVGLPIVLTDSLPVSTTFISAGQGGSYDDATNIITWEAAVDLDYKEAAEFAFVAGVGDVPSGTVISNLDYQVSYSETELAVGEPYTVTIIDPILFIHKATNPDPIGSNTEASYELTVFNKGSLATSLVITDIVPQGVDYLSGGTLIGTDVVSWSLPSLNTGEMAVFSFTFYVSDVMSVDVSNLSFGVCSAEGACASGTMLVSTVWGPTFEAYSYLDPIAKKPGGGGGPVTPTLVVKNIGPGVALDAHATLCFERISVSYNDLVVIPSVGDLYSLPDDCGINSKAYLWIGNMAIGDIITFTTIEGQSTIGGGEGTHYTATVVITDDLTAHVTDPVTGTAIGHITHFANLIPTKSAPPVIGQGELLTYTIEVFNSGLSTDPPDPILTETVPASVTLIHISDGGVSSTITGTVSISWTLPAMSPGDRTSRQFTVRVPETLVSGTQIVNDKYRTSWFDVGATISDTFVLSNTGVPVTTTVMEVGLIDSFKVVSPQLLPPAETNVLTYVVHVVNSGPLDLTGVRVYDLLPWKESTFLRDAQATSGEIISDIVSVEWVGDVGPFSAELITFSVLVDPWFEGTITNTAVIRHTSLLTDVIRTAVAYITDDPVLFISKTANPSPVRSGEDLLYTIKVVNLGQQATQLIVTDTVPLNTTYIPGSASEGGLYVDGMLTWNYLVLPAGESHLFTFRVNVGSGDEVVNASYRVSSSEGVSAVGDPLITPIVKNILRLFLPIVTNSILGP